MTIEVPTGQDPPENARDSPASRPGRHPSPKLSRHSQDLRVIGISLSALYEAATCHRRCQVAHTSWRR